MGLTTTATLGQLKKTQRSCDACGQPAASLAGSPDKMLCETCDESELKERAERLVAQSAVRVDAAKAAQNKARQAAKAA